MKVKLINQSDDEQTYFDLTLGNVYRILGISDDSVRVFSDCGRPYLFPLSLFEIVDPTIPDDWVTEYGEDGEAYISPPQFKEPGFWEDYFDDVTEAINTVHLYTNRWHEGRD